MNEARLFLIRYGAPIVFGTVLIEQLGLPLPAIPWLLAAGALCAVGQLNFAIAVLMALLACLVADGIWFYLGRYRGSQVLGLLCKISLEPDSCVRRTQNVFTKYGWRGIVIAKFVPGLSTIAPPLAGMSGMHAGRFLLVDSAGSVLYGGTFIALGFFFSSQLQQIGMAITKIGSSALCLIVGLAAAYIGYKYWQRRRLLDELRMTRISVDDLRKLMDAGQQVSILDMRSSVEFASEAGIKGAIHLTLDDVREGRYEIPRDREVVVYCSCPNEITAARVALLLRSHGFTNVRPLLGGIDAWRQQAAAASAQL
jgi:membrane protein DedA with SNARE-associated domain/rhodanese-related sulfurtransferase